MGSKSEVAAAAHVASQTLALGSLAPGLRAQISVPLAETDKELSFAGLSSSCGCLHATLVHQGVDLTAGQQIPAHSALQLRVLFAAKGAKRRAGKETVRLRFESAGIRSQRFVDFTYEVDPKESLVAKPELCTIRRSLPVASSFRHRIPLRRPLARSAIAVDKLDWLALTRPKVSSGSQRCAAIDLNIGPIEADGEYVTTLRITQQAGRVEHLRLRVIVAAPDGYRFSPRTMVLSLPAGGTSAHPVTLFGHELSVDPSDCKWEWEERAAGKLRLTLGKASATSVGLLFRVEEVEKAGLFRGRVLLRPNASASFRIALPFLVRVY